jgi:hypothetical protein|tara:strand:+ start:376 stop:783 length:408 start_codon:yes stop_codon:yes gene_type:complete
MRIKGLDGREYRWNPTAAQAKAQSRSSLHTKAKELLDNLFPYDRILEEVSLVGSKTSRRKSTLRADFFIPNRNLVVEVHGEQHYKFNNFFFKDKMSFYKAKARDSEKREWCELNEIQLVEFNYNEDIDEWRSKIE